MAAGASAAAAAEAERCTVVRLTCKDDLEEIKKFAALVKAQLGKNSENFKDEFPWEKECYNPEYVHYIAHGLKGNGSRVVCGWCVVLPHSDAYGKRVFLIGISTRRTRDELYGGVGQLLHNTILEEYGSAGYDFIHLWPLNTTVRAIYKSDKWGYVELRDDVGHLFRILNKPPSAEFLDSLVSKNDPYSELNDFMNNYTGANSNVKRLYGRARHYFPLDKKEFDNLSTNLQSASMFETEDEVMKGMKTALTSYLAKYGQRVTRSHASKAKKTSRKKSRR